MSPGSGVRMNDIRDIRDIMDMEGDLEEEG
jgi:hypothetical protein